MPTFETVPIEKALKATVVDTWLEERFGEEHDPPWETEEFQAYIVSDGNAQVYETVLDGMPRSILSLEEAKELISYLTSMGKETILFRLILEGD